MVELGGIEGRICISNEAKMESGLTGQLIGCSRASLGRCRGEKQRARKEMWSKL